MIPVRGPDGKEYRSIRAAAREIGMHKETIRCHMHRYGNIDLLGSWRVPCVWNGKCYPTIKAAAAASGFSPATLFGHLRRYGNLDRLGVGRGGNPGNKAGSKEFHFGTLKWPSRVRAAKELGICSNTLARWSGPGATQAQQDKLLAAVMAYEARQYRSPT